MHGLSLSPDCRVFNRVGCVLKNRSYTGLFYCIKGVHNAPIESSKSRFIGLAVGVGGSWAKFFNLCETRPRLHNQSNSSPLPRVIITLSRARCGTIRLWVVICSAVDIHYPQAQNHMTVEDKNWAKNINITQKFRSLCFPLMLSKKIKL